MPAAARVILMEVEAKFRLGPAQLAQLAQLRQLGAYTLSPAPAPEFQENTYYDTADGRLGQARHGLRVRRLGARTLVTLKGPAERSADGVQRRVEHEFPSDDPNPRSWPAGPARKLAQELIGDAPLVALLVISTERQVVHAERNGANVAELCLDQGVMRAGSEHPFSELEIELLPPGSEADLAALIAALNEHVQLVVEPQTKLERAMELLNNA